MRLQTTQSWDDFCHQNNYHKSKTHSANLSHNSPNDSSGPSSPYSSNHSSPRPSRERELSPKRYKASKSEEYIPRPRKPFLPQATFLAKSGVSPLPVKNEVQHHHDQIVDIGTCISENEEILRRIGFNLPFNNEFCERSRPDVVKLGVNLKTLLELTDSIARPKELPFMPIIFNFPPEFAGVPQEIQAEIQKRDFSHV
ncbi:hypothetical protein EIN_372290 [Entamoeba invadens IP1]|uniref:Uncharacterized protein n=1 Tax=Entamoeba invadens IP1 TaxID=370355 RepID=A0A0A1UGM0_ENTIV|nr:hypothetical protein EIN_372290 [Entamoeba invadens IP1]ELP92807.1 hypothetical protein EIN_372290 [Entamoeba invadens IP1]|eukprot:XP_004259578.1 hypothetical protein EIN_372290 [Entamoeba invadens IP1]